LLPRPNCDRLLPSVSELPDGCAQRPALLKPGRAGHQSVPTCAHGPRLSQSQPVLTAHGFASQVHQRHDDHVQHEQWRLGQERDDQRQCCKQGGESKSRTGQTSKACTPWVNATRTNATPSHMNAGRRCNPKPKVGRKRQSVRCHGWADRQHSLE
jgi:hypothetical protein